MIQPQFRWFPVVPLPKYPHLQKGESALATAFVLDNPLDLKRIAYDVPLGSLSTPPPEGPKDIARDWNYLKSYKADAVGYERGNYHIVEFKVLPSTQTASQLLFYKMLFKDNISPYSDPGLAAVSTPTPALLRSHTESFGIKFYEYDTKVRIPRPYDFVEPSSAR
ncbi:MAG: hypothetical protein PVI90_09235 [Desulfobacteraceae bacterium]|jgi:hypothetical protein